MYEISKALSADSLVFKNFCYEKLGVDGPGVPAVGRLLTVEHVKKTCAAVPGRIQKMIAAKGSI